MISWRKLKYYPGRQNRRKITKDPVHHPLKRLSSILEAKRKAEKLKEAKGGDDGSLWDVCRPLGYLEISLLQVKF